ncbi:MAG: four helix bundle protein [Bacteroidota bacterium]|nr:four helix bundle protein [Bacteroidota bacterium]
MLNLSHKNLEVYKIAMNLVRDIYKETKTFPKEELYILVSQIRRAAISVCSNIAEGASRISKKEKKRFYEISRSSLVELDTQLVIAIILDYYIKGKVKELEEHLESTFKMLSKMINNLSLPPTSHSPNPSSH